MPPGPVPAAADPATDHEVAPGGGRWRRRAVAAALGLLAALALAEVLLRLTGAGVYAVRQADYHFVHRPGERFWRLDPAHPPTHAWDGDPYGRLPPGARMVYEVGVHGLRGPPPAPARPVVLVLGDSFVFGEGVALPDTLPARLERAFGSLPGAPAFVNAGVPGYGTPEQAARLPALLDELPVRAVLLVAVPNDAVPLSDALAAPDLINARGEGPSGLRLVGLARSVLGRAEADAAVEAWYLSYYVGAHAQRGREAFAALAGMAGLCRARNLPFRVALFPLLYRLADRPFARIHEAFGDACERAGVPFLDLTASLAVEPERALWVHPTDHHPDARAHELAADALKPFVADLLR